MAPVIGIRDENNRPVKAGLGLMRRPDEGYVISLNDYLVSGSFPNSAKPIFETTVAIEALADALPLEHLQMMLDYKTKLLNKE